jgi:hypothetical protein
MTVEAKSQEVAQEEQKPSNKELNFRQLEAKYERTLAQERAERERLAKEIEDLRKAKLSQPDDDEDDEPYVDKKKLAKHLAKFGEQTKKETQTDIQKAVQNALAEERKQNWIKDNSDFYDVMQNHAERFLQKAPQLAETILQMPEGFERQKLVYHNIKTLGLDKPEQPKSSIQETIDANRRSPYYQPSAVNAPPYAQMGDFSDAGQKNAHAKMKELQKRLRI